MYCRKLCVGVDGSELQGASLSIYLSIYTIYIYIYISVGFAVSVCRSMNVCVCVYIRLSVLLNYRSKQTYTHTHTHTFRQGNSFTVRQTYIPADITHLDTNKASPYLLIRTL